MKYLIISISGRVKGPEIVQLNPSPVKKVRLEKVAIEF
jgi:hypothetical protein